jgi:dihydroorotate dehydrogenase
MVSLHTPLITWSYRHLLKPVFFTQDPETVHDRMVKVGERLGQHRFSRKTIQALFNYQHKALRQSILGIDFANPIGLAAGFDKNAQLLGILPAVGFGFVEVGSITGQPCPGNPTPRLWRLPKSRSLCVYYGLKNDGAEALASRLAAHSWPIPVGISAAKTNNQATVNTDAGIQDYLKVYQAFKDIGQYATINISCPNTFGGEPFTEPDKLQRLLAALANEPRTKPLFLKISPDLSLTQVDKVIDLSLQLQVDGLIIGNLTKNRDNARLLDPVPEHGGFSGKVVEQLSDTLLAHAYRQAGTKLALIGCGGVFSAEDAYRKIRLGASLVQLVTGLIYQGPQLIGQINRDLVSLLQRDGYTNISQAIGVDNH